MTGPNGGTWSVTGIDGTPIGQGTAASGTFSGLYFSLLDPVSLSNSPTTVTGLSVNNSPDAANDYVPYYNAASGKIERCTVGACGNAASSGVGSLNGLTGGISVANGAGVGVTATSPTINLFVAIAPPQGRLTLASGTPVMTTSVTNATTVYYDCYNGQAVPIFDGTRDTFLNVGSCEISTALQSSSTGVLNTANVFDVFAVNVSGTLNICVPTDGSGGGWASDTGGSNIVRGSGYSAVDQTRGYVTNTNAITHCYTGATDRGTIAAHRGTYLGTFYTTSAGQTSWTYATNAGVQGVFALWNAYNRVAVATGSYAPNLSSWSVSGTLRQWAGLGLTTGHLQIVQGLNQESVDVRAVEFVELATPSAVNTSCSVYIGLDSSTAIATNSLAGNGNSGGSAINFNITAYLNRTIGVGVHNIWALDQAFGQICPAANITSGTGSATGIFAMLRM